MQRLLVTGGAGFIGVHATHAFSNKGVQVMVVDDLSRKGSTTNLKWLRENCNFEFRQVDISNSEQIRAVFSEFKPDSVLHLAAQVAVTTSVTSPRRDFEINAIGSFNVLEAIRLECPDAFAIYSSTNKVYGNLESLGVILKNGKWSYQDVEGVDETFPLDFYSPYGCSKGCADQYFIDYSRIYGIKSSVFRQSCIYGTRQFGIEDQGWVAWFTIASMLGKPITVYGDGRQTRDVLFVDDLIRAYELCFEHRHHTAGKAYNVGGGQANLLSLLDLLDRLSRFNGKPCEYSFSDWRPGDQRVFVCDTRKAKADFGWEPTTSVDQGVLKLMDWVEKNRNLFD